jgi:ABC-type phosphate transport system auxiliary subunit
MNKLAKRSLPESLEKTDVEASAFIVEGGQLLADQRQEGGVPAEQVFGLVQRYEDRMDDLVTKVTSQSDEVNELTRAVETERRAALGARHRLQVSQLETKQEVDNISHGAERIRLEATYKVQLAGKETEQFRKDADSTKAQLQEAKLTIDDLRARLELVESLGNTAWYQFGRRKQLSEALLALPEHASS